MWELLRRWVPPVYLLRNIVQHYTLMQSAPLWIVFQTGTTEYIHSSRFWERVFQLIQHFSTRIIVVVYPIVHRCATFWLLLSILRTLPLHFCAKKRAFFKNIFLLSRHSRRQFGRANVLKTTKSFMHVAFTTYFFTPSKKEKRCQEFLVRSFIEKRKIGIAFFSSSL